MGLLPGMPDFYPSGGAGQSVQDSPKSGEYRVVTMRRNINAVITDTFNTTSLNSISRYQRLINSPIKTTSATSSMKVTLTRPSNKYDWNDVVKLFDTPQLSGILHFQTLFFIIVRADITQRRM